jgi:hypothetical protein
LLFHTVILVHILALNIFFIFIPIVVIVFNLSLIMDICLSVLLIRYSKAEINLAYVELAKSNRFVDISTLRTWASFLFQRAIGSDC